MFQVTREWMMKYRTTPGAWTRRQIEALGIAWPPRKGWLRDNDGVLISQAQRVVFESDGGHPPSEVRRPLQKKKKAYRKASPRVDVNNNAFLQSYNWRQLRMRVLTKRGARCECCGATPAVVGIIINVDHIKPRSKHPELALVESNLQVLCNVCNHGKGSWDETDWRKDTPDPSYEQSKPCWGKP